MASFTVYTLTNNAYGSKQLYSIRQTGHAEVSRPSSKQARKFIQTKAITCNPFIYY